MANPSCDSQATVTPIITCVEGIPNLPKTQSVQVMQGQAATIDYVMRDQIGNPIDLTDCLNEGATLTANIAEASLYNSQAAPTTLVVTVLTPSQGLVAVSLTAAVVAFPGISKVEIGVFTSDVPPVLIFSNTLYLIVNRGLFGPQLWQPGPPTIAEIRLHLRDSDPSDNLWLGVNEFDLQELAACIERPIHYFNESPPPINQKFNTANFPARHYYLEAIIGCLYQMASLHYARVHLPYQQAQGLMVDDKNKAEIYTALGKERWESWKEWVRFKKVELNAKAAFQTLGSPYFGGLSWTR